MMISCILVWDSISPVKPCKLLLLMPVDLGIFQKYSEPIEVWPSTPSVQSAFQHGVR